MLELNTKPKPEVAGKEEVKVDPKFEPKQELESVADEPMVDEPMWKEEEECEEVTEEAVPPKQWQASSRVLMKLWKIKADLEFKKRQAGMLRYLVHGWHEGSMPDTCEAHVSCMKRLSVRSIWGAFEVLCWFEFEVLTFESDVTPYRMKFERFYFAYHAMAFIFACRGRSKASTCKTSWSNVSKVSHELSLSCHPGIFSFHVMPC